LEAGKHVIVEKPFVTSVKEGEELIEIAKKKGKTISVYQNRRYDSDYRTVKKIVNEGILGDIVEAEFHFDRYKAELSPKTHKESPIAGSGALFDLGSHIIDQALELFGKPDSIFADIRIIRPLSQVNDYFEILMFYPHLRVRLHCSYIVKEALPAYILHGTSGSFIKAKTDVQENALLAGKDPADPEWGLEPEKDKGLLNVKCDGSEKRGFIESLKGNYYDYYDSIFHMIRNNSQNPVTPEEGLEVIRVIEAANKSVEDQKIIPFK
jgi:predicted dehydrogenase